MMTPEEKAEFFKKALAETGDVVAAFRQTDKASRQQHPARKMPRARVEALRAERAKGRKLAELAGEFGITEGYASLLCRGVVIAEAPQVAAEIVRIVGAELFTLPIGWERVRTRRRAACEVATAQRVATLAMAAESVTHRQMAAVMGRCLSSIGLVLGRARANPSVRQMAKLAREILAREAAPIAVPEPLPAPVGVAA